jgi:tetratricopeptide (TPR) repeat protein
MKSKLLALVIFLLFHFNNPIYSQSDLDSRISIGLESLYNFNFKSSERIFDNIIKNYPAHPAGYYYKSISHLWFFLDGKDEEELDKFISLSDSSIEKAEELLQKDSSNQFVLFILGSCYVNRTFAFTRNESYFDAVLSARKFHFYFDELLSEDSLYYDAYMSKGIFNFAISQAPQTWSWALNLAGMTGNKKIGLDYLESASTFGRFTKIDAQFYLSQIYSEFLLKYQPAKKILNNLNNRFPKNLLFRFALANLQVKIFDLYNASNNYKAVYSSKDTAMIQLKYYAGMTLGNILYSKGEYEEARDYYINFIENASDNHFKGMTALKIGLSYLFEGDSLSALLYFDKVSEGNEDLDDDIFARVKGESYLAKLPSSKELKLILIKNMIDAGKFKPAIDSLEKYVNKNISDTLRAEAILYLSDAYYFLGKSKKSLEYAVAVFNFEDCELWVKPFACYYAARASKELKNNVDAEFFIGYANNFNNYFYENKLRDKLSFLSFSISEK